MFIGLLAYGGYRRSNHNAFGHCTVITSGGFGGKARTTYKYKIGEYTYEYSVKDAVKFSNADNKFIITYDSLDPKNHNPILSLRYRGQKQIDSLQKGHKPSDFASLWSFNSNDSRIKE
jgi:hypothetical protein